MNVPRSLYFSSILLRQMTRGKTFKKSFRIHVAMTWVAFDLYFKFSTIVLANIDNETRIVEKIVYLAMSGTCSDVGGNDSYKSGTKNVIETTMNVDNVNFSKDSAGK